MKTKGYLMVVVVCLALVIVPLLSVSCPAPTPTQPVKPIELKHNNLDAETYAFSEVMKAYMNEIEEGTGGRVKFTFYSGGALTTGAEIYEGVVKGVSHTGLTVFVYSPGRFPVMEVCDLPGYPSTDARLTSLVAWDVYNKFKPAELDDVHVLFMNNFAPGIISTRDKPIHTLADLKGLKIRSTGATAPILEALGASPVSIPVGEAYPLVEKGTVDGSVLAMDDLLFHKFAEVCKYSVILPTIGHTAVFVMAMNLKTWDSLPADIKEVFNKVSPKYVLISGEKWNAMDRESYEAVKEMGHIFTTLPPEELTESIELVVDPLYDEYVTYAEGKGLPGREIVNYRHEREQYWLDELGPVASE